ncbi:MAG: hypothetical protein AAGG01_16695, partial [Planctomycetota bacterium]
MAQPYTQKKAKKRPFKSKKPFFKQKQAEKKGTGVYVDFDEVPKDLKADEIEELIDALPKTRKKKLPTHEFIEVQRMNLGEIHEVAEEEKVEDFIGRNRRDALWELGKAWIARREPIFAEGVLDHQAGGHHWLRVAANDYTPAHEDVYVPASIIEEFQLERGMTVRGPLRPTTEGEKYFCLQTVESIDLGDP